MRPEYFINQMLEKINRAELNLYASKNDNYSEDAHIDK